MEQFALFDALSDLNDAITGIRATYSRISTEIEITISPTQEWLGDLDGEYTTDIEYSLWSFRLDQISELDTPKTGDRITIHRDNGATESYQVCNHDRNQCFRFQFGNKNRSRVIVYTRKLGL